MRKRKEGDARRREGRKLTIEREAQKEREKRDGKKGDSKAAPPLASLIHLGSEKFLRKKEDIWHARCAKGTHVCVLYTFRISNLANLALRYDFFGDPAFQLITILFGSNKQ